MNNHAQYWVNRLDPVMIHFTEDFGIRYYGLAYALAFVLVALLLHWYVRAGKSSLTPGQIGTVMSALIFGVVLGGRLGYIGLYAWHDFIADPLMVFRVWEGGMSSHGGFIGVALAFAWIAIKHKWSFLHLSDMVCATAPIGLFLGRIANFINGELWGKTASVPWAVVFPRSALPGTPVKLIAPRHPSQIYEALLEGVLLFAFTQWLVWGTKTLKKPGRLSAEFLIVYGVVRIFGEQFRAPDAGLIFGMSRGIFYSLILMAVGLGVFARGIIADGKQFGKSVCTGE